MNLAQALKNHAKSHAIFYVTLDPERALGLEDVLQNYTIICPYTSQLTKQLKSEGVSVLVLQESMPQKDLPKIVEKGTYGILQFIRTRKIIFKHDYVMVLKNSQLIEDFCKKQGWKLLAPKAKVAEQFENKISQYKLLKGIVQYPQTIISTVGKISTGAVPVDINRDSPRGIKAVLQFNRGHSGNSTFFIKSVQDLAKLKEKFPKREAKISEYIKGKTYTLNCLVLSVGEVITGSLSEQITGLKSATNNPNTTCGNDFTSPRKLAGKQVREIREIAQSTGAALYEKGYRGLFGIDVIIQNNGGKVYFIEVNTHQPASISFEAKLHRKIGKTPLLAYFILDSLNEREKPTKEIRQLPDPPIVLPFSARQIIYRNKTAKILRLKDVEKKYKGKGLISRIKYIKPNEEIYRKQQYNSRAIGQ